MNKPVTTIQFTGSSLKFLLFLVASPFLSYMLISRGINAIWLHPIGTAPTQFQIERFAQDYDGERWLHVNGTLMADAAWSSNASDTRKRTIFVPVVPADWRASEPVHLIAHFTQDWGTDSDWRPEYGNGSSVTLVGETAPPGSWDYRRMFPGLMFPDRVVVMYVGQTPSGSDKDIFELVFGILIGLVPIVFIVVLIRRARARRIGARVEDDDHDRGNPPSALPA